jgi:serine/threonine-protein kinase
MTIVADDGFAPRSSSTRASSHALETGAVPSLPAESAAEGKVYRAGDTVDGRYVLIEQLGKGGMGVVWKALSTALDVEVAVKLLRSSKPNAEAVKRMAREAHAAARLGHPAMATVLDFGATPEGAPYVVMELLRGESLGEVLGRERRVDVLRAIGTLLPIMDGLREAHALGIVHRDLKPENLFISRTARGRLQPKVLDFGIAKLDQSTDSSTRLTRDGAVLGSPGYFSPEQARGDTNLDARTDIWSISVVLYEMITGDLPFSGPNYNALLMSILQDTPRSIVELGFGDEELWRILKKGMHRDRTKRWGSVWELGRALAAWLYDKGIRADVASRSLEEVWLEARTESEHCPAPEGFGREGRAPAAGTLRRRVADTLAGGTLAALGGQRLLPARLLGLSALAAGMVVIAWGLLVRSGAGPSVHTASPSVHTASSARPSAALPTLSASPPSPPRPDPAIVTSSAEPAPRPQPVQPASKSAQLKDSPKSPRPAPKSTSSARPAASPVQAAPIKTAGVPRTTPIPSRPVKPVAPKRIDREFGF